MKKSVPLALVGMLILSTAVFAAEHSHWAYSGAEGPENWVKLSPEFGGCAGKEQSPINLAGFIEADLPPILISYRAGGKEITNNGHTVQVNYEPGSSITVDGTPFELKQFHFHWPSENIIEGKPYPLEAHLVHADKAGNLAVVAVLFTEGAENAALAKIWPLMPKNAEETKPFSSKFDVTPLLPSNRDYYRYSGSLTTPPCSEGVRWLVMKNPVSASKEQIDSFAHVMHHPNNRPVQPVNARPVLR